MRASADTFVSSMLCDLLHLSVYCRCALSCTRPWLQKETVTLTVVHKGAHLIILLELVLHGGQIVECFPLHCLVRGQFP